MAVFFSSGFPAAEVLLETLGVVALISIRNIIDFVRKGTGPPLDRQLKEALI